MHSFRRILAIVSTCILLTVISACHRTKTGSSRTGFALDTVISIAITQTNPGVNASSVLDECFAEIERFERLFSATMAESDVSRINTADGSTVTVAEETADLLQLSLHYATLSNGAFDITLRPVTQLWDFSKAIVPDAVALQAALATVDYRQLTVEGTRVTLPQGGIELGGIAKGYIADRVRDILKERGVMSALIDLGGNIIGYGTNREKEWRIGIKDPAHTDELYAVVTGRDFSVVTSGIYERGFDLDGVRYHHLLSPETGMPVQNGLASVTIVCQNSAQADALSTACFVLGEEKALELLNSLSDVEALFIRQDGSMTATAGLSYTIL